MFDRSLFTFCLPRMVYSFFVKETIETKINVLVRHWRPRLSFEMWRCRARRGVCRELRAEASGVFFVVVAGEVNRRNNHPWSADSLWHNREPRNCCRSEEPRSRADAKCDNTYLNQSHARNKIRWLIPKIPERRPRICSFLRLSENRNNRPSNQS